jgi:hypothetical protein
MTAMSSAAASSVSLLEAAETEFQGFEKQVADFQEHLKLALQLIDDPKLQVILKHALEEEQERSEKLTQLKASLLASLKEIPLTSWGSEKGVHPKGSESLAEAGGHFKLRDEAILTVGNLFGSLQ